MWGLYTGMEAPRKAPQGYRLCKGRLRAPTRDTFAYAKRLREESRKDLFHLFHGAAEVDEEILEPRLWTGRWARTCRMAVLATRMPPQRLRRGYAGTRTRIWNQECTPFFNLLASQGSLQIYLRIPRQISKLTLATRNAYAKKYIRKSNRLRGMATHAYAML